MKALYPIFCLLGLFTYSLDAQVVISEFSAANYNQFFDNYGEDEDWIELHNTSSSPVDISGYYLSDRLNNPTKWEVPAGVIIPGNGYLTVWASRRDEYVGGTLHTNFKITQTRNNEDVVLADPSGTVIDFNAIDQPNQSTHSWARLDGDGPWGIQTNPTPGNANNNVIAPYAAKPNLMPDAGFYTGSIEVTINDDGTPNQSIYYTTDGSTPSAGSLLYTGPFLIHSTTVVKAITISDDPTIPSSFVDYHTYFIDETHSVPVISIAGDDIISLLEGFQFEPIGSLELFDENGERVADATGDFNKHGNDSWAYAQRGIDYITRDQFGDDYAVKHQIFPEISERDRFQRLIIKAAANDNYPFEDGGAHIRDAYVHTLSQLAGLEMDERTNEPCVMYVNGQYWGVYEIREKVDDHDYTDFYYNQDQEWIDFIKTWGGTWEEYGSWDDWYALRDYIENNDMSDPVAYAYVDERLNLLSLADYIILHSHNVSSDWLNWNTGWWRGRNPDGEALKWRYILWDEDATFGHYVNYSNIPDQSPDADPCNPELISDFVDFEGHVAIFSDLLENPDFFALYINRYADLNSSYFTCDYMISLLDQMIGRIEPEMQRQVDRWGGSVAEWLENVETLKAFIETRCTVISGGIVDCYEDEGITGPYDITINVEPEGSGKVQANTIIGQTYPWQATYFGGIEVSFQALPEMGFAFSYWEVNNNTFGPDEFSEAITMSLESGDEITANFIPAVPCAQPFNFLFDSTTTSLTLAWNGPVNTLSYEVRYREQGDLDWINYSTLDTTTTINGLSECRFYDVEVRTICDQAVSEFVTMLLKTSCLSTSVYEAGEAINQLEVFPNPFRDQIQVQFTLVDATQLSWELYSITGQLIQREDLGQLPSGGHQFNLQPGRQLADGMYILELISPHGRSVRKLVKK